MIKFMKRRRLAALAVSVFCLLGVAAVVWAATISQQPYGMSTPRWYGYTSGVPDTYYLAAPSLSANDTAAGIAATQTLTNKTLTTPTITSPTITGKITMGGTKVSDPYNYTYELFKSNPTVSGDTTPYTPAQAAAQTSYLAFGTNNFEWNVKVTPTVTTGGVPKLTQTGGSEAGGYSSTGLDIAVGAISGDGYEMTQGFTDNAKHIFTIGTSDAFYFKAKYYLADASGAITAVAGFRSVTDITADGSRGYTLTLADYPEYAVIGKDTAETIKISTELREGGQVTTDTTNTWTDASATHTMEVYVSSAGVVTYKIDGAAPTATAAFTFTGGIKVIPFFWITHGSDICEYATIESWECGYQ